MLTRLRVRNFKRFDEADIELGQSVVLIGANNCGKTTALQALALWDIGRRRWFEKREGKTSPEKRPGVTINRRDLISIPVPNASLLWRDMRVRSGEQLLVEEKGERKQKTKTTNIRVDVIVDGVTNGREWSCGFEFDYANEESFYCRPLRSANGERVDRMPVPLESKTVSVAFLPPMSGLAGVEAVAEPGRINVLIGEGRTAEVLRNLCYQLCPPQGPEGTWEALGGHIKALFGVELLAPKHIPERGEITMQYREPSGTRLDLSSSGRGLQQTLLLLAHLYANPKTVLLLDEPDAHLEILRQRQTYKLLTDVALEQESQIVAASHSEVVLNEAADRDVVIAFVGKPHRIGGRGSQVLKALCEIGFEDYYQAEQTGWVLYLEGSTDLAILQAFAHALGHDAVETLNRPFIHYVGNNPREAQQHFFGLQEAKSDLLGVALFDRLPQELPADFGARGLTGLVWRRREIENYLCSEEVLLAYARHDLGDDLFGQAEADRRVKLMSQVIDEVSQALETLGKPAPWSPDTKATDDFLDPLFQKYFNRLELPNLLRKSDYHVLASLVPSDEIDPEVREKLDVFRAVAARACPRSD
ncbi:MAG: AAA family ATPase [Planctomycetes bacterium]|nr:AAA family ATPase [Planctomycetota bacterium]